MTDFWQHDRLYAWAMSHAYQVNMCHMYMTDFAYDGPIFLVPLSLSSPSSPVLISINQFDKLCSKF